MKSKYDDVIITNIPAFYKVNLFNRVNEHRDTLVLFSSYSPENRESDFFSEEKLFDYIQLRGGILRKSLTIIRLLSRIRYSRLIVGGWNEFTSWIAVFTSSKNKNCMILESTQFDSITNGLKGWLKRHFIKRIKKCFVPGKGNAALLEKLRFNGKIVLLNGVGIFNRVEQPTFNPVDTSVKQFLYVGRLAEEKNLKQLINVFNTIPDKTLTIVGSGPQEKVLKSMAGKNIYFMGAVNNKDLYKVYQRHQVFVLPSTRETWGLVVEEALNNGLPVIGSSVLGSADTWLSDEKYGLTFDPYDIGNITYAINRISELEIYNSIRKNISCLDFKSKEDHMVRCFVEE